MSDLILNQLQQVNVALTALPIQNKESALSSEGFSLRYEGGVLFCGGHQPLGAALLKLFDTTKYYPH